MSETPNPLVSSTACLLVHFSRPGIKRKLRDDQYVTGDVKVGEDGKATADGAAEKVLTGAQKVIVDSPEYKRISAFENHVKFYVATKALPSKLYRSSTYLIPLKSMQDVAEFLEGAKKEWSELVDEFLSVYPTRKAETMARLGKIAEEADYKTEAELRSEFGFDHEYVTLSTPSTLKQVSMAMFQREEERFRERLKTAEDEIVAAYRGKFSAAVEDMKAILSGNDKDGKAQRFHGWKIPKLQQYIADFKSEQNVCGDAELANAMSEAEKLLAGVNPKELRNDAQWRASLAASFGEIGKKLEAMTRVRGKRLIDLDEDEDEPAAAPAVEGPGDSTVA